MENFTAPSLTRLGIIKMISSTLNGAEMQGKEKREREREERERERKREKKRERESTLCQVFPFPSSLKDDNNVKTIKVDLHRHTRGLSHLTLALNPLSVHRNLVFFFPSPFHG